MKVIITTIPKGVPHKCGYSTAGDWWYDEEGTLHICVTESGNEDSDTAVAVHEWIEARHYTRNGGIVQRINQFDHQFEEERDHGLHSDTDEPGDDPRAPYWESHQRATHVERATCHALDLPWDEHGRCINA